MSRRFLSRELALDSTIKKGFKSKTSLRAHGLVLIAGVLARRF